MPANGPNIASRQAMLIFGSLTAVLLLVVLFHDLKSNLRSQWSEGGHRTSEAAFGIAQMAQSPIRSSANAVMLIAEEMRRLPATHAPNDAALQAIITTVLRRQPQLAQVALIDTAQPHGASSAFHPGQGEWTACAADDDAAIAALCFGAALHTTQTWMVPVAAAIDQRQWVVGQLQGAALAHAVAHAPDADNIAFAIVDADGHSVLEGGRVDPASSPLAQTEAPGWVQWLAGAHTLPPLRATATVGAYPFTVKTAMSRERVLAPWRRHATVLASFYLFYLAAFICLLRIVGRAHTLQRHYIRSLQAKTQELRLAQRAGRTALWSLSEQGQRFECHEDGEQWFGMPPGQSAIAVPNLLAMVFPTDRLSLVKQVKRAWRQASPLRTEFRLQPRDGVMRRLSASGQVVIDATGRKRMVGTLVDVTEQWAARQRQIESEHRFDVLFEQHPLPFWVFDTETLRFLEVNAAAIRAYGYTREEFLAMTILDIRDPSEHRKVKDEVSLPTEARSIPKTWVHRTKSGGSIDVRIHSADIVFAERSARLILAEDITAQLADERELSYRASHDLVTGLPNQHALIESMDALIVGDAPFEVAYLQLLGMDAIADTFGINIATGVLQVIAVRLAEFTDGHGYLASVTQQSFVWMAQDGLSASRLKAVADCVSEPIYYKDTQHQINIVIGVARHPQDGTQSDALLARAALAAHVHTHSDVHVHYFEPSLAQQSREKLHFSACLRRAVKRHEFELHFQIITDFQQMRPIGLEALIRWPQGDGSFIPPTTFIPICEEAGLIIPLGQWVLNQAAKASRDLRLAGFGHLPIAINVSPTELRGCDLVANIRAARSAYALADGALRIELTESSLIEHKDRAIAVMKQLRADGVAVALDDFGTGFSGLSYLRDLPIDTLKIDQAFVRNVDRDERSATICEAIIALGKSLKVDIVAEGIERYTQYRWLQNHGCDAAQGFYVGKPEPLPDLLKRWSLSRDAVVTHKPQ